ncbi:MAG TPA: quinone oxidoreductase [Allosphingosinicella sp.]|nr:quinone oxidoreductase [Allosphingosinicella sp.]
MARAIVMEHPGGPEVLALANVALAPPGPGQLRLRQTAVGVNYHDVYVRSGLYRTLELPGVPGIEGVGIVEEIGANVTGFEVGDRIGYVTGQYGCYAEARNLDAALAVKLPDESTDVQWAASLMKAFTVCMLVRRVHKVVPGETVLVHAAAGGVGQLLCSWARHLGAQVIGTVGSQAKADIAIRHGADHVILYREQDIAKRVAEITEGNGVAAAYDSVGADTFQASIDSLGFEGQLVNFGQASGPVAPFTPALLASRSLSVSRPIIFHYLRTPEKLAAMARETFEAFARGAIRPIDPMVLPLAEAAEAHRRLEARESPGGIVLIP